MARILIVEDDKDIARALQLRLVNKGFEVSVAHDAATATIVARKAKPDVALLDISMPGGSGFDVAERLLGIFGSLPMIFLSADGRAEMRTKAKEMGALHFFAKPFVAEDLVAALSEAA